MLISLKPLESAKIKDLLAVKACLKDKYPCGLPLDEMWTTWF